MYLSFNTHIIVCVTNDIQISVEIYESIYFYEYSFYFLLNKVLMYIP